MIGVLERMRRSSVVGGLWLAYLMLLVEEGGVDETAAPVGALDEHALHLGQQLAVARHVLRREVDAAERAVSRR